MEKRLYTTPEIVKEFRKRRIQKNGELPDFIETLKLMETEHALAEEPLPFPVLDGNMSKKEFMKAYDQVPVEASKLLRGGRVTEKHKSEGAMFRNGKDVVCVQHIHDYGYRRQPVSNFFSVTYLYQGTVSYLFEDKEFCLNPGDLIIITPRFQHYIHTDPDTFAFEALMDEASFHIVFNDFLSSSSRLSDFFSNAVIGEEKNYCIMHGNEDDSELRFYLQSFAGECLSEESNANTCAISLMKLFLGKAFRKYGNTMECMNENFRKRKADAESIYRYISNNCRDVTLEQTAKYFHYNESYLSRYIKTHFGKSFKDIITELKIDRAREYLKNTNKHITDIALLAGYDSADHFSRMFRKYTGMSPAAFRKQSRIIH